MTNTEERAEFEFDNTLLVSELLDDAEIPMTIDEVNELLDTVEPGTFISINMQEE